MEIKVLNIKGEANGSKNISFPIEKQCDQAVFDQILVENCAMRQGTHSTLTKGEVSGGGIKPRPQKHSGRARQGSIRNPQ
jgi:large subunit ribosomal protein L4